jgi:predicted nucleic acid-binding protein
MIYIDTSSLLKLVITDPYSDHVERVISQETGVLVTTLGELEARVQLRGLALGGTIRKSRLEHLIQRLCYHLASEPFVLRKLSGGIFDCALEQTNASSVHCRSLDRLHLAAMAELGVKRLMTHDGRQAEAARELGYEVEMPGVRI